VKRTSRKSSSAKPAKAFRVVGAERVREGTAKVYVDAGRDGELWVTVYPDPLPMRVFSPSSNVQWLQSDLTDAQRKLVRLAASRALVSNGRFKRTSRMAANGELQWWGVWTGKHHQMNVLASSEADAIARFERKTRGMVFVPGGVVTTRLLDDQFPRGRSAPMPLPHWKPRRNPEAHGATFPGTLAGYHAAHGWLLQHGFHPVPGSSRYEDSIRRTGRIVDAGRDYRVEVEKKLGRNPEAKLDKQDRAMINESLIRAGLDGNGRFRSVGMALSAASGVLDDYGLEPDEVLSAWKFSGPSGHTQIHVAQSNRSDPFSPTPIGNSVLAFSWHQHGEGRWEALAYMS